MAKMTLDYLIRSISAMNISDLSVDRDYASDNIVLTNTKNGNRTVVSRTELENTNLPYSVIASAIEMVMPNTTPMPTVNSGTISVGGSGGVSSGTISVGGGGGGFGAVVRGAMGSTFYVDDPHANLKDKLFSDGERLQIMKVKDVIRAHMNTHVPMRNFDMSHVIVAGGCFASMLNGEVVKDFDVFLLDSDTNRMGLDMIEMLNPTGIKSHTGDEYIKNDKIEKVVTIGSNAIQYISTKYKNRLELIEHFDFKHCCVSYDYKVDRLFITRETFDLIKSKTLKQNTDKVPEQWRFEKFESRGWRSDRHRHA